MKYIEIEQIGSPIRRQWRQRETLKALKLNKIERVSWRPDTPATRGMIEKVRHLVRVNHDSRRTEAASRCSSSGRDGGRPTHARSDLRRERHRAGGL